MKAEGFTQSLGVALRLGATFRAALLWTALGSGSALAGGVVTNCAEADVRTAMEGGGLVTLACEGTITLSNTLRFTANTIIDARGHSVVLSGGNAVRVLEVGPGAEAALFNLTITQGRSTNGGGIYNEGALALSQCNVLSNCAAGLPGAAGADGLAGGIGAFPGGAGGAGGAGLSAWGGGIFNAGLLRASNCVFAGNQALGGAGGAGGRGGLGGVTRNGFGAGPGGNGGNGGAGGKALGGALCNLGDTVCVRSTLSGNEALGGTGGASGGFGYGMPTNGIPGAYGNGGGAEGGACFNAGALAMDQTLAAANQAAGGRGRLVFNAPSVEYPTNKGGHGGAGRGGALCNVQSATMVNVTLTGNSATGGAGAFGSPAHSCPAQEWAGGGGTGGALVNLGALSATHCTIWNNWAAGGAVTNSSGALIRCATDTAPSSLEGPLSYGWGASVAGSNPVIVLNTILGGAGSTSHCVGTITDLGHNLCSDASAAFTHTGSLNSTDPLLAGLGDNGGPTRTLALRAGSPAINAGDPAVFPAVDQRGFARPAGPASDIGAFEGNGLLLPVLTMSLSPGSVIAGAAATLQLTVANPNSYPLHGLSCADTLPPELFVAAGPQVVSTCGGDSWSAVPASRVVFWSIPELGAGQSCTLQAAVSSGVPGVWTNRALEFTAAETGPLPVELSAVLAVTGPNATTAPAASVTSDGAILNGSANPNGAAASAFFQYGTTTNYGQETPAQTLGSGTANVAVTASLSGLANTTPFHFRLVAQNANGAVYGNDQSFTTLPELAAAATGGVTAVSTNSATIAGSVTPNGLPTLAWFEHGLTTSYGSQTPAQDAGSGVAPASLLAALDGLVSGLTYHYRMVATNLGGRVCGPDQSFMTISPAGMALVLWEGRKLMLASAWQMADMPPWTAEMWFRSASGAGGGLVGGGASHMWPNQNFQVYLTPNGQVHFGVSGTNSTQVIHTTNSYTDGQWHHVAASVSAQGARLFLDGRLAAQETAFTNFRGYGGYWIVGYGNLEWPGLVQPYVNTEIDEVRVWTTARPAEDIRADMYRILSGPEPGLAMRWRFDESDSASVTDSSGHDHGALIYSELYFHGQPVTTLTRTPSGFLSSTLSQRASGAKFVRFQVPPAATSILQASSDLVHWTNVATNSTPGVQAMDYEDREARPLRFYRVVNPE